MRNRLHFMIGVFPYAIFIFYPDVAHAYVGPGAGLTAIGSLLALIAAILVAIIGFFWYPLKRVMNRKKTKSMDDANQ